MLSLDDRLLDAAAALVRRGDPLSIAAVAAEAGVSRGAIYKRWADREALVAALVASGRVGAAPDTRERILDAVGAQLRQHGIEGTTIEAVATQAGVGAVTIYRHFGDRRSLLLAFLRERTPRRLAQEPDPGGTVRERLERIARAHIAFLRENRALAPLLMGLAPDPDGLVAELRASSPSTRSHMDAVVLSLFPDPTGRTAMAFQGVVITVGWFGTGAVEDDARFAIETFLHGVQR